MGVRLIGHFVELRILMAAGIKSLWASLKNKLCIFREDHLRYLTLSSLYANLSQATAGLVETL